MNDDEISFGDLTYREPRRLRRPDLDGRWACIGYETAKIDDLPIFLDLKTADTIERHALRDTSVELGGILLGQECLDEQTGRPFVWVTQALEAKHFENSQVSFTYTHDSWEAISRERERLHPDLDIVGWYHTHPDFGIFLSHHDLFIHHHFFAQPLQVAYVVDPIRQDRGFFQWRDGSVDRVGGFSMTAERADRLALARFVNDLEHIPEAGGGLGALSPRLEAELIAMLARPSRVSTAADTGQTASVFGLLGVLLGVLGLAAVLWLNTLTRQIQTQTSTLDALGASLKKADEEKGSALAAARVAAKEDALNSLLREVKAGSDPGRFVDLYAEARRDRDEARLALKRREVDHEAIFALNQDLRSDLTSAREKHTALEEKAKKVADLQEQVAELKAQLKEDGRSPADGDLARKYTIAWYGAVVGGLVSLLLGLALAAILLQGPIDDRPERADESPPHRVT